MPEECGSEKMNGYKKPMFGVNHDNFGMEWANSCVGNNGYIDSKQYYDGYIQASIKLMEVIFTSDDTMSSQTQYWIDTLIYPICFTLRHSIETLLKRVSETVIFISDIRSRGEDISVIQKNISLHDIKLIWDGLKTIAILNDERYKAPMLKIEPFVMEIAEIDPTGQTFRYAYSNDSVKHLTDVGIINIATLYENTCRFHLDAKELFELSDSLHDEYSLRTFTKKMSRFQLEELSKELPNKSEWSSEYKKKLQIKHNITSNDLTKALDIIKSHYIFSSYIDSEVPLQGIKECDLFSFIDLWIRNEKVIRAYNLDETKILTVSEIKKLIAFKKEDLSFLNPDFVAGLFALHYYMDFSFPEKYVEEYRLKREQYLEEGTSYKMEDDLNHLLLFKTRLFDVILRSMKALNQRELISKLEVRYGFLFPR
ncbi:hypothetical protein [Aeromonas hydrophila]|uniref:hypothetical protein n=1 Tax=Aeromonas hydrophila TaxID=644 RepID=UPI00191DEB1B|nr:hypothetical protein [Aeromonas hydrophila]MBL0559571.1 hypothetical protein [Aeromonas hydrophila]